MPETSTTRHTRDVVLPSADIGGTLSVPIDAEGIVLFAHGSGSGRFSPRNSYVAAALREANLATFLVDLLTSEEASDRAKVFDIPLLAERLLIATEWVREEVLTRDLAIDYFGASTGAGAALVVAARASARISAVVSRGGRPDLAGDALAKVQAPTLLIVGSLDHQVLALNRAAFAELTCEKDFQVVGGATHLFEEPGTLDDVIALARRWFQDHLKRRKQS